MREIDPFSFFINHASAISGLGGENLSPDARYCFHTNYVEVRPGPARYELQLARVRASRGELALRIHALRPHTGENASLVAGARLDVAVDEVQDLSAVVRFSAMRNVLYAFYGYFIEDSDIHADGVKVLLHEYEGEEEVYVEPPRSILALELAERDVRPANALIHVVTPHLTAPVSQDCTVAQIAEVKVLQPSGNASGDPSDAVLDAWAETLCLNALRAYGVISPALEGIVVGDCSDSFAGALATAGFSIRRVDANPAPPPSSGLFGDFLVWPAGLWAEPDPARRWDVVKAWFGRLKIGGLGIITCRYRPRGAAISSSLAIDGPDVTQNEIGKWALRLIAEGYSVAPLAFSPPDDLKLDADGLARFALIAQRL